MVIICSQCECVSGPVTQQQHREKAAVREGETVALRRLEMSSGLSCV